MLVIWCGIVYLIGDSLERPFLVQVLYFVGVIVVGAMFWMRFRTDEAWPLTVDLILGLFVLCLAYFLRYNSLANWGWSNDPEENPLAKFFKGVGFSYDWAVDPRGGPGAGYKLIIWGIPLAFAFAFLGRPWRFGLRSAAFCSPTSSGWSGRAPCSRSRPQLFSGVA